MWHQKNKSKKKNFLLVIGYLLCGASFGLIIIEVVDWFKTET